MCCRPRRCEPPGAGGGLETRGLLAPLLRAARNDCPSPGLPRSVHFLLLPKPIGARRGCLRATCTYLAARWLIAEGEPGSYYRPQWSRAYRARMLAFVSKRFSQHTLLAYLVRASLMALMMVTLWIISGYADDS